MAVVIAMVGCMGKGWRWLLVGMRDKARSSLLHVGRCRNTSRVGSDDTDNIRSDRLSDAQLLVESSRE